MNRITAYLKNYRPSMIGMLGMGFMFFVIWAAIFELDQSVRATGQVIVSSRTQVIQAADGGVLSELPVHEGMAVQAGQTLAVLEQERAQAGFDEARAKVAALKAALIRTLEASYPDFVRVQRNFYLQRKRSLDEELSVLRSSLEMAQQELTMNQALLKTGDVSEIEALRAKRQVFELQGKIVSVINKYRQDSQAEATKLEDDLSSNLYKLADRESVLQHTRITTPVNGIVKSMRLTTLGGVLRPGDELMQIAPTDDDLVVEAKINPADVALLKLGLPVQVKLDAFDPSIYGGLEGSLVHISPDTLVENNPQGQSQSFYRAHVRLNKTQSNPKADKIVLKPGMTASLDIQTGTRTVMSYLFKPVFKTFSGALRER
jgi:adhesin transport system membrane fusion protein